MGHSSYLPFYRLSVGFHSPDVPVVKSWAGWNWVPMQLSNLEPALVPGGFPSYKGLRQHHLLAKKDTGHYKWVELRYPRYEIPTSQQCMYWNGPLFLLPSKIKSLEAGLSQVKVVWAFWLMTSLEAQLPQPSLLPSSFLHVRCQVLPLGLFIPIIPHPVTSCP